MVDLGGSAGELAIIMPVRREMGVVLVFDEGGGGDVVS